MGSELTVLALYGLLVLVTLLIQVLLALPNVGLSYLASPRDDGNRLSGVAGRAQRCLENSVTAMALFAPAVLILAAQDGFTANSLLAAQAFLIARLVYVPVYLAGIPWLRTLIWLVGFLATAWLYLMALGGTAAMPA
ncbi:MAPEG family protein [Psychromarinibacter sp. C21-152]|uniref:MAPEG family protein n=1 Tax=Psychromarinibacter sediminicola TaxID=3033385 RepID=A0AAE3NTT1_9RHOB|nr:MAPEG family protein [Psychromarinibacter sediminicola]MDF0602301.1 MAPEG family protein [Psychromarinibacter sediminicola]